MLGEDICDLVPQRTASMSIMAETGGEGVSSKRTPAGALRARATVGSFDGLGDSRVGYGALLAGFGDSRADFAASPASTMGRAMREDPVDDGV